MSARAQLLLSDRILGAIFSPVGEVRRCLRERRLTSGRCGSTASDLEHRCVCPAARIALTSAVLCNDAVLSHPREARRLLGRHVVAFPVASLTDPAIHRPNHFQSFVATEDNDTGADVADNFA